MSDITIVIATHNRPDFLRVELDSILVAAARVQESVRILVVDDASDTLDAQNVARRRGADYLRMERNRGVGATLAAGFAKVKSPLYAFWGDDDYMLPNWFELHLAKIAEGYDVVAGSYLMADAELNPTSEVILPVATFEDLKAGQVTVNDGALVRRDSIGDIRFRPERERIMMMTFWLAMASAGKRFGVVETPTWLYRRHPGQLTHKGRMGPRERAYRAAAIGEYR